MHKIAPFFLEYHNHLREVQTEEGNNLSNRLEAFTMTLSESMNSYRIENRQHAYDYNLFTIIGKSRANPDGYSHLEARTHSPFWADLLDPTAEHGQEDLFYKHLVSALKGINYEKKHAFLDVGPTDYIVLKEENNIDILIRSFRPGNHFAIVIENKINGACDQEKQITRYYDHVRNHWNLSDAQILIIYATKNGTKPTDISIKQVDCDRLMHQAVLICLSWKDIAQWIDRCRKCVESNRIRIVLDQYHDLLGRIMR
jgi:hypothetical protein